MTAQVVQGMSVSDLRVVRQRDARRDPRPMARSDARRGVGSDSWGAAAMHACVVPASRGRRRDSHGADVEWTPRGLAVMVVLIAVVTGIMLGTLVTSFLSVSNDPIASGSTIAASADVSIWNG